MSVALKIPQEILPEQSPIIVNRDNILSNPFLLDEKNFVHWHKILYAYLDKKERQRQFIQNRDGKYIPHHPISYHAHQLIEQGKLPHDYQRRLILRQLALGCQYAPGVLAEHNIILTSRELVQVERRTPDNRQPVSPYDFVLIDTKNWQEYANMQYFYDTLATKPSCAFAKDGRNLIRPKAEAIKLPYIAPYHPQVTQALIFDIDADIHRHSDNYELWKEYNLPPPNIIIKNPYKDSYQYIYLLRDPVCNWGTVSKKFIALFDLVYKKIRALLKADPFFNGSRMKNPFSPKHDVYVSGAKPYNLYELADKADIDYDDHNNSPKPKKAAIVEPDGYIGRNVSIFNAIRHIGYSNAYMGYDALYFYLLSLAEEYNRKHYTYDPLPQKELCDIAKSITRYCKSERFRDTEGRKQRRIVFARQNAVKANAVGACVKGGIARAAKYAAKRTQAHAMDEEGYKIAVIAEKLCVTRKTLRNWGIFKKGKVPLIC